MASVIAGTLKQEVSEIHLKKKHGITGDAHAGDWHRPVSLPGAENVEKIRSVFPDIPVGAFSENILTDGIVLEEDSIQMCESIEVVSKEAKDA